jgi:hypothetical protein
MMVSSHSAQSSAERAKVAGKSLPDSGRKMPVPPVWRLALREDRREDDQ